MKKRYLVFLVFFIFLYIGPVNLLPSYVPPAIVEELKIQPEKQSVVSTDYNVVVAADSDDDWWNIDVPTHYTTSDEVYTYLSPQYVGQFRWQLNVPKDATIDTATFTGYETQNGVVRAGTITRINETNVGDLEADVAVPDYYEGSGFTCDYSWDGSGVGWGPATDIKKLVQAQVNLADWESGFYFGLAFSLNASGTLRFEDYQAAGTNHAYLNITYTEAAAEEHSYLNFYSEVIQADGNDDTWNYDGSWNHVTTGTEVIVREYEAVGENIGQFRFQLDIPKDAIIYEATITAYEINDAMYAGAWIWRINETDVGDLEADVSVPTANKSVVAYHKFNSATGWTTSDITDLVQAQVNLTGWQSGYHIGLQFNTTTKIVAWNGFEDYQHASTHHAYVNVTYLNATDDNWLSGWEYRKSNVVSKTAGAGADYTLKVNVSLGDGDAFNHTFYTDGKALTDFGDIRFTTANGTLLSYNLSQTITESETDYFSYASVDLGFLSINYPCAYYYNGRTYVSFQGDPDPTTDGLEIYIMYYNHISGNWSGVYYVGHNFCVDDEAGDVHGSPAMWIDDLGYINVFYGAHNEPLTYSRSVNPEDATSFEYRASIPTQPKISYPKVLYDSSANVAHLMYRFQYADGYLSQVYTNSSDYGVTWSTPQTLVNFTTYWKWPLADIMDFDSEGKMIHFGMRYRNGTVPSQNDEDVYYMRLNVTTGHLFNASGYDLGVLIDETTELPSCQVYESGTEQTFGPAVHIDENKIPYVMFTDENGGTERTVFTYWNGTGWHPLQEVSSPNTVAGGNDFIIHSPTNISAFVSDNQDIQRYTWDGATWTHQEEIYDSAKMLSQTIVPINYVDSLQVFFTDYDVVLDGAHQKMYAWGTGGRLNGTVSKYACFYVEITDDLTEADSVIYVYYGKIGESTTSESLTISESPWVLHSKWGIEETILSAPVNAETPNCSNLDDTDNLYARYKGYAITVNITDADGFADIDYMLLSLYDDTENVLYWSVKFDEDTATFSEYSDTSNMIYLDTGSSTNSSSGNTLNITFSVWVHWNHTDLTDIDLRQYVIDDNGLYDMDWYEVNYDVETRLDLSSFSLNDGEGTVNRGDYDTIGGIVASGVVVYYGSALYPDTDNVDVWIRCADVSTTPWFDTTLTAGGFSVAVDSDDEVGLDTYKFKVVEEGGLVTAANLLHDTHTTTYIADRLIFDIAADEEDVINGQQVNFTLTITYDYDDTVCSVYQVVINRNDIWWHSFTNANSTLFNDTNSDVGYSYTIGYLTSEATHGLTKFLSDSVTVTWTALATTTTTTFPTTTATDTENGIFYELFLSRDMWSYLGPFGLVVMGYLAAKKDKGLGVIAFVVQCLFIAQYLALVAATPAYWWHIFILLVGSLLTCVAALMDKR